MARKIYTLGYSGRTLEGLKRLIEQYQAMLFDIRYKPASRNPDFSQSSLKRVLGDRYRHIRSLGNQNFTGATIEIVDLQKGMIEVMRAMDAYQVNGILMCVCKTWKDCHRTVVRRAFTDRGFPVEELNPPLDRTAPAKQTWGSQVDHYCHNCGTLLSFRESIDHPNLCDKCVTSE